jgi:hypothetical protein
MIAARPSMNSTRFRQRLSSVYASATRCGSAAVPGILRQTGLLRGGLGRGWRQGRAKRHGELGTGMSGSLQIDSAAGAGAASNCRMSGGPQARRTVGLIHWQSFAKNFMFFVRRRRSAVGRVSDSYVYILDEMGALY